MENYEKMLDDLYVKLPEKAKEKARFEMPKFEVFQQGSSTMVPNFVDVAETLRRDPKHLMKYLCKESATQAMIEGKRLVMKGKFRDTQLNDRLESYAREYVLCKECKKPDTDFVTQEGVQFVRCEACGARSPVAVIK